MAKRWGSPTALTPDLQRQARPVWREMLVALKPDLSFRDPARDEQIDELERALSVALPTDLKALLRESDGVSDCYGAGLVWPTKRIVTDNRMFRRSAEFAKLYMPIDGLLFFADAGERRPVRLPDHGGRRERRSVRLGITGTTNRRWYAGSFDQYFDWWLGGEHPI
jgi:hypothetical protein